MALVDLWKTNKAELDTKHLQQIIAIAGDGKLADTSTASSEFRALLRVIPSDKLGEYARQCLESSFDGSGLALQDIVNEIGRRLAFAVEAGRYRGKKGEPGHDGLWTLKNGRKIIVEVKTTDAYSISLDTVAEYRKALAKKDVVSLEQSSILLVVGRKDTGGLEAQIRGSRYAWDMRIISVDALLRLMSLKESLDDPTTASQISDILVPQEFTRVDSVIDLVFATAEEVAAADGTDHDESKATPGPMTGKKFTPVSFHAKCAQRIEQFLDTSLIKETRTAYRAPETDLRVLIAVSKTHGKGKVPAYWFAFHPHQKTLLEESPQAKVAFGCGSEETVFLVPLKLLSDHLHETWTTEREGKTYWHIHIQRRQGKHYWALRKGAENIPIDEYLLPPSDK